jgi:hypothetical protein
MDVQIPLLELQNELQRFATSFTERITQAAEALQHSPRADVRDEALRKNLLYVSSAMEIASGPSATVSLLDMFVFVHLSRAALERHWIPTTYGESGRALDAAFAKAEEELLAIATRALGEERVAQLTNLADAWLADNPGQVRVEGIRLADFAGAAGTAAADRALQARGLLSSMKVATEAANEAMVVAERAMFLFHRFPFMLRLHVRLAVRDVLDDALVRIKSGGEVAALKQLVKRATYVALLGAATTVGVMWLRSTRKR